MFAVGGERRCLALALALLALGGCAQVLGLPGDDELTSIAKAFCRCEGLSDAWPGETCEAHVEGRLASADPEVRRAWLDLFTEQSCELCDNDAGRAICAGSAPLCVNTAGACGTTQVCCLADGDSVYCGAQGVCVEDAAGCLPPQTECGSETPCCGEAGQLSACLPFGDVQRCVEACNPLEPGNCAGCCARTSFVADGQQSEPTSQCLPPGNDCESFCNLDAGGDCGAGRVCVPTDLADPETQVAVTIDACLERCQPLLGQRPGSPCTTTLFGFNAGCCARVTGPDGDPDLVCLPSLGLACSNIYCDASAAEPGCATCVSSALPGGETLGMTIDTCP